MDDVLFSDDFDPRDIGRNHHFADWQYDKIMKQIQNFEKELDNNHEIALLLASFGTTVLMQVADLGYQNPDLMYFWGYVNGKYTQLIQHVSQLNFLITSIEKEDKSKPPKRIGFTSPADD